MKYFTPELIVMGRSVQDDVLNEQERLWEQACDQYVAYLDGVRAGFPPGLGKLDASYYLHDSTIQGMGRHDGTFVIIIQLDTPPRSILTLTCEILEDPTIIKDALTPLSSEPSASVTWQYDEIEMISVNPPVWRQSILLSNGWEVNLLFRDVQVNEVQAVLPVTSNSIPAGVSFILQHATGR